MDKRIKCIFGLVMALVCCVSLCACAGKDKEPADNGTPSQDNSEGLYDVYRSPADFPADMPELKDLMNALKGCINLTLYEDDALGGEYETKYRYFAIYRNDDAGNPYITDIYATAVLEGYKENGMMYDCTFYGENMLYKDAYDYYTEADAEVSLDVSKSGDLFDIDWAVKVEEFFPE